MPGTLRILIVDDDDAAKGAANALKPELGPTVVVGNVYQALEELRIGDFDAVITELALPGASGIDLLERLSGVPAVVVSWLVSPPVVARALGAGAYAVLPKPYEAARLLPAVRGAVETSRRAVALR